MSETGGLFTGDNGALSADLYPRWTPLWAARTITQWRLLLPFGAIEKCPKNFVIFSQGDVGQSAFLLMRGMVKLVFAFADGGSSLLGLRYPGHLMGDWWMNFHVTHPVSAVAAVPSEMVRIETSRLREAEEHNHSLCTFHRNLLESDVLSLVATNLQLRVLTPAEQLQRILWEIASVVGHVGAGNSASFVLPLSNAEMAALCGLSESHYKAVRRKLEQTGALIRLDHRRWVLHRRHFERPRGSKEAATPRRSA